MSMMRCECGDTECPSCGTAQGTYRPKPRTSITQIRASQQAKERRLLLRTLVRHGWNQAHAARELGVWVTTLKRMMAKHGIENLGGKAGRPRKML